MTAIPASSHSFVGAAPGRRPRNQRMKLYPKIRWTTTTVSSRNSRNRTMSYPSHSKTGPYRYCTPVSASGLLSHHR